MANEQSLVLIKPDGLVKSLSGNILTALSETKLKIVGAKIVKVSRELAEKHYYSLREERGEELFEDVLKYIQGHYHNTDRVFALVYEGENAIEKIRNLAGATNPEKADATTIRGKYGRINSKTGVFENVVHASADPKEAEREIKLWFKASELVSHIHPVEEKENGKKEVTWK